jgi:O-antigen ligase
MRFMSVTDLNIRSKNIFLFFVCAYFASLCLFPSKAEAVGFITLALTIMQVSKNDRLDFFKDPALYALLIFGAYSSAVNAFGPGEVARTGIIYGWAVPFLVGKAFARFNSNNLLKYVFFAAMALAGFMLAAQILLFLGVRQIGDVNLGMSNLTLTFRNSSRTAIFVATGAFICLTYAISSRTRQTIFLAACSCVTLISALVGTGSRMTLMAFLLCSSIFLFLQKKLRILFFILAIILCTVPFFGKEQRFNLNPSHLISTQSATERFTVWYAAWEVFKEHPMVGSGFRTFKEASAPHVANYRTFHPQKNNYETLSDAHNIVLHLLSESGLIGISIFTMVFFYGIRNSWKARLKQNHSIPLILCIALIFLHAQLHVNIFATNVSGLLFLLTGMSNGVQPEGKHCL